MKQLRPYKNEDHASIVRIYAESKMDELKAEKSQFTFLPLMQDKERSGKLFESKIFVYENTNIVGYCAYFENEIRAIYVSPDYRGKGIGNEMLEFLVNEIQGCPVLFVAESNKAAKRLYRKHGFQIVDEFETKYNGVGVVANKMKKFNSSDTYRKG